MKVLAEMGNKIAKLIDVKSIVTIILTIEFVILANKGNIPTDYLGIYTMLIGFYFGIQKQKTDTADTTIKK